MSTVRRDRHSSDVMNEVKYSQRLPRVQLCLMPIHWSPRHRSFHVCRRSEHPNSASPADDLLTQPPAGASTSAQPIAIHDTPYLHRLKSLDTTISAAASSKKQSSVAEVAANCDNSFVIKSRLLQLFVQLTLLTYRTTVSTPAIIFHRLLLIAEQ